METVLPLLKMSLVVLFVVCTVSVSGISNGSDGAKMSRKHLSHC